MHRYCKKQSCDCMDSSQGPKTKIKYNFHIQKISNTSELKQKMLVKTTLRINNSI